MSQKYSRRKFIGTSSAALVAGLAAETAASEAPVPGAQSTKGTSSRPNLILYMPDELRADALACYGNPVTKTPNFDRVAAEGTRFENCHVQYPVCGASRCSLLTGWPTSVRGHRSLMYFLRPEEPNLFRYLRQAGYEVFWFGKNDALAAQSFYDSVTVWNYSENRQVGAEGGHASSGPQKPYTRTFLRGEGGDPRETQEYTFVEAANRILERKEQDRPFCIFLPLSSPHPPYTAPKGFYGMYSPADIDNLRPRGLPKRPNYVEAIRQAYGIADMPDEVFRKVRATYYSSVSYSDWLLGQLLEALDRTGHDRDTALFVLSDHGDYAGDYGLVEKWPSGLEDCLTHVPLIARVRGGKPNGVCHEMVELFDVMATCLELSGAKANHTHFARTLMPQIQGGRATRTAPPLPKEDTISTNRNVLRTQTTTQLLFIFPGRTWRPISLKQSPALPWFEPETAN